MKRQTALKMLRLQEDANARRLRLAGNVAELRVRMQPRNLWMEAKEASLAEFDRVTDELLDAAADMLDDSLDWINHNRALAAAGALLGISAVAGLCYARRRKPVPIYAAYNTSDPGLLSNLDNDAAERVSEKLRRVKDRARSFGAKAETSYGEARARARVVAADARSRAAELGDVARRQAADASDAALDTVARARALADDARAWAQQQKQERPGATAGATVLLGLLAGACLGVLTPRGRK